MSKALQRAKLAELRALRKAGKKTFDTYEVEDAGKLYEEVDEDGYKKIVRDRLNQDDFVVDDNGEGYADDGREEWDRVPVYESDSEDDTVIRGRPSKAGTRRRRVLTFFPRVPVPDVVQPRSRRKMSRRSGTPTTATSASTSPRVPPRFSPRRRYDI